MATYDYSQFYKTKSPTGYDIFRSGGQKLSYEEATPMFQSGFNVAFIGEKSIPQSGGIGGTAVPIGQSAAVSAKQAGLPGVPTGGTAGAPTYGQPTQQGIQPPTTPVNISVSPEIDSDSLSLNNYRTGLNSLLEENKKAQEAITIRNAEAQARMTESKTPSEAEFAIQRDVNTLNSQLRTLSNQERQISFGFLPEEYLKTEKGLKDVGISEAQLQRRIATEQAPIARSFTDRRLDLLAQVEERQGALGLETAKRTSVFEQAKTEAEFAQKDQERVDKMLENQMQIEQNILDYAFKLDTRSQQGLGTILKAFDNYTVPFEKLSKDTQKGIMNMAKQFGISDVSVIPAIFNAQVDGNLLNKTQDDIKTINSWRTEYPDAGIKTGDSMDIAQSKILGSSLWKKKTTPEITAEDKAAAKAERESKTTAEASIPGLKDKVANISGLVSHSGMKGSVGSYGVARWTPLSVDKAQRMDFIAGVEQIVNRDTLDTLIGLKAQGGTLGALSDQERIMLQSAASKIGSWRLTDDDGKVYGYETSEEAFKKELNTLKALAERALTKAQGSVIKKDEKDALDAIFGGSFDPSLYF